MVAEYAPDPTPESWDPEYMWRQLQAIADAISTRLELDGARVPDKPREGMLNYFGEAGDPGAGRGFYGRVDDNALGELWSKFATLSVRNVFTRAQYLDNDSGEAAFAVTATDAVSAGTETASLAALGYNATLQLRAFTAYTPASASYLIEWRSEIATKRSKVRQLDAVTQAEIETYLETFDGGDITVGSDGLGAGSTEGFLFIPAVAGAPTGTPTARSGFVPICYDTSNDQLYVYNGSWVSAAFA